MYFHGHTEIVFIYLLDLKKANFLKYIDLNATFYYFCSIVHYLFPPDYFELGYRCPGKNSYVKRGGYYLPQPRNEKLLMETKMNFVVL